MKSVDLVGPFGWQCRRALKGLAAKDPSVDANDLQSLKLVGAIKTINPGMVVSTGSFKNWSSKTKVFHTQKRMAWIQSKASFPDLGDNSDLASWIVPEQQVLG